eukprot:40693-Rhodomonas_salina.2
MPAPARTAARRAGRAQWRSEGARERGSKGARVWGGVGGAEGMMGGRGAEVPLAELMDRLAHQVTTCLTAPHPPSPSLQPPHHLLSCLCSVGGGAGGAD